MSDKINHIIWLVSKGYRLPHDIEVVACEIYYALQGNERVYNDIINDFIKSVMDSKYSNIIEITYDYMDGLIYSDSNLLHEEFLKVIHLFDSINIFIFLELKGPDDIIGKSDAAMIFFLKKYAKWSKGVTSVYIENKKWWQRVIC
ncbi:hypothetical protein EXT68_23390 [Pectobacterium parmentieri]|uniref:Uncharacterized protein n=1 Tax=Pectobacterium parmentieri TaxID=1905730 RepID=A0A0H3HXB8_PECPM|nr:hypothetical protein [Pectobacterium parmentieri]AFI88501.1 Hypothetical protein W5S_0374 [Pectobacterium parmentieri]AYH04279.1 hypothetical protein C5E25_02155 [Pectobacterium parmentieri]AYH13101.1 hypothetical protein C5E23_02140 [Pectobacterium parmentieri]AYH21803.1 hypothetical protein C5E21_02135 [Pectobacterium parmentieri]MBI0473414.1 hypothetical protein [Pectobacterium parmentieri]